MGDSRNRPRLTEKEAKWLELRASGMTPTDAAKEAGYADPYSAAYKLSRNQSLIQMNQLVLAAHGVDLPLFAKVIKEGLNAKKLVIAKFRGELGDEKWVEDHDIRLRTLEIAIELAGVKPAEEHKFINGDEDDKGSGFLTPTNFNQLSENELLLQMQRRRQALATGIPFKDDDPVELDDIDDDDNLLALPAPEGQ